MNMSVDNENPNAITSNKLNQEGLYRRLFWAGHFSLDCNQHYCRYLFFCDSDWHVIIEQLSIIELFFCFLILFYHGLNDRKNTRIKNIKKESKGTFLLSHHIDRYTAIFQYTERCGG